MSDLPGMEQLIRELLTGDPYNHSDDYKRKYAMIDDLVHYALGNDELRRMYNNTDTFASGFTPNIGKLVMSLLNHCRENETFQEEMRKAVADCEDVPEDRSACSIVTDRTHEFVRVLEGDELICYFGFFAIICELCKRFRDNEEFVSTIKNVAKGTLYVYWENTLKYEELDAYARDNLDSSAETFQSNFAIVVDYLYKHEDKLK